MKDNRMKHVLTTKIKDGMENASMGKESLLGAFTNDEVTGILA